MSAYIRIWQNCEIENITKHLLILGDITGDCASCRELGIDYSKTKNCPKCGTDFRFISARNAGHALSAGAIVKRVKDRRPDLTFIDYGDYKELTGKQQAREFFK